MTIRQIQLIAPTVLPAAVAVLLTAPASTTYRIGRAGFSNPTAGALAVTAYLVPAGGLPSASNVVVPAVVVSAGATYISPELAGLVIPQGSMLQAFAGAAASIVLYASGISIS